MMRLLAINPNSTASMTATIAEAARAAAGPGVEIVARTNASGPPAIQGPEDGAAALPGVLAEIAWGAAQGVDAFIIACFDDTGLEEARALTDRPVIGIGEAAFHAAAMLGARFSVVTTLAVSVPVIEDNLRRYGLMGRCAKVRASGVPVLALESDPAAETIVAAEVARACAEDGASAVVLGCAGMADLADRLAARTGARVIDGVRAATLMAQALARLSPPAEKEAEMQDPDPVAHARAVVEAYLEASMAPDPVRAATFVSPALALTFTGGRRFSGPADCTAFNAKRYAWVKKRFLRTDAALDPATGDVHVYNTGHLYGAWPDGTPFETNRYIDIFTVRDGLIVSTDIWNDSAEILLARAGLAEAPL